MRKLVLVLTAAATLTDGAQAEEITLEPAGAWVLDYHPERCRLARAFGQGDLKTVLFLDQLTPSGSFSWLVSGPVLKELQRERDVSIQFAPGFEEFQIQQRSDLTLDGYGKVLTAIGYKRANPAVGIIDAKTANLTEQPAGKLELDGEIAQSPERQLDLADGSQIDTLRLTQKDQFSVQLKLGNIEPAFKAMNACMDNLVSGWGLDPAALRRQVAAPKWLNQAAMSQRISQKYPRQALNKGQQADFQLRVMVAADGSVNGCSLVNLTTAESFSDAVCPIVQRGAQFEPARDQDGMAMPSYFVTRVVYRIY